MPNVHLAEFQGSTLAVVQPPALRCVGRGSGMSAYHAPLHSHPCAEVVFVVSGEGCVDTQTARYSLFPGAIALYAPQERHSEQLSATSPTLLFYHANLDDFAVSGLPVNRLLPPSACPVMDSGAEAEALRQLFELIFSEAARAELGYRQTLDGLTDALFTLLLRVLSKNNICVPVSESNSIVYKVQQYIMSHYSNALTVKSLAERFHVDSCYLSHAFKKALGLSPCRYINEFRIGAAGRLLKSGSLPIAGVAEAVGCPNVNTFSAQFKKFKGLSPCEFRKQARESPLFLGDDMADVSAHNACERTI